MKIVFIVGGISDSHIIKRVQSFKEKGYEVEVYGFQRNVNANNSFGDIKCQVIGQLQDQRYIGRVQTVRKAVIGVLKSYPKDTLFYVWGYDIASICYFMKESIFMKSQISYIHISLAQ